MFALALLAWCGAAMAARAPPLDVPRCCPADQRLAQNALLRDSLSRDDAAAACETAEDLTWEPRVYAPARAAFLERGKLPVHWRVSHASLPACPVLRVLPEHAAPFALLANNASLLVGSAGRAVPPTRYCADASGALVCEDAAGGVPRVRKCCGEGRVVVNAHCEPDAAGAAAALEELKALAGDEEVAAGWPVCAAGPHYVPTGLLAGASLGTDGALLAVGGGAALAAGAWCADGSSGGARVWACAGAARGGPALRHVVYGCALAVGALFLAATLAAGLAVPAQHHALHWRCQTHYVAALLLGDILLAATQLAADAVPPLLCRALAVCMHFLFLSAFFWLNTMCFNIWWTFRDFRPTRVERGQEAWRLRVYALYAWGGPGALAATAAALDAAPGPLPRGLLRPRFADARCWFAGDAELLVYFFGPVGVLLLINLALFISTTRQLTCGLWRRDEVKSTSERAALGRVCAKLVVVMGVTWGADVVSWAAGGPEYVWYATDVLNALQGVLIFLVAGARQHAAAALRRALARLHPAAAPPLTSSTHLPSCGDSLTHSTPAPPPAAAPPAAPPPPPRAETAC